jgi:hypothetical protein
MNFGHSRWTVPVQELKGRRHPVAKPAEYVQTCRRRYSSLEYRLARLCEPVCLHDIMIRRALGGYHPTGPPSTPRINKTRPKKQPMAILVPDTADDDTQYSWGSRKIF